MGAGKSYIGKRLAERLDYDFMDLDDYLESKANRSISDIFEKEGEDYFRQLERQCLLETFDSSKKIIATGGGTPCFFDNIDQINQHGLSIFLDIEIEVLLERLMEGQAHRPLLQNKSKEALKAFIVAKINQRRPFYESAHLVFTQKDKSVKAVEELYNYLSRIKRL